jgi:hypothetical protein
MFWIRLGILLGLLIWTASASAGEIDRSTDGRGTIHITTPKSDKTVDETAIKPADKSDKPDKPDHLDYKSRPLSRRPMDPYGSSGSTRKVRPSPYLNLPPEPVPGTPGPEGVNKGTNR